MSLAVDWAKMRPTLDWIDLSVFADNKAAIKLYENFGFKKSGELKDHYRIDNTSYDHLFMTLNTSDD